MLKENKDSRSWFAIYTRPRFERKVAQDLDEKGISSYVPTRTVERFWSDRRKLIQEPLFPSYVLVYANSKERYWSLQTDGAVRMVCFNGQPARIPDQQIEVIRRMLNHGYDPEPHEYLQVGDKVEVTAGPLLGVKGFVSEHRGRRRFVISIDVIRQSIAIEVEKGILRKSEDKK